MSLGVTFQNFSRWSLILTEANEKRKSATGLRQREGRNKGLFNDVYGEHWNGKHSLQCFIVLAKRFARGRIEVSETTCTSGQTLQ